MNFNDEKEFTRCSDYLKNTQAIWSQEALNAYPESLKAYKSEYLEQFAPLNDHEEWLFECRELPHFTLSQTLVQDLQDLENLPRLKDLPKYKYPTWAFQKVSGKKRHEIETLAGFIQDKFDGKEGLNILDIGGGAGHLGRTLGLYHGHHVTSLDLSEHFQELGRKRLHKYPHPEGAGSLTFVRHEFGQDLENDKQHFNKRDLSLGLHTCGPLAISHLKQGLKHDQQHILNVGCCYHKLGKNEEDPKNKDVMLSKLALDNQVYLNKYALTLATRGRQKITFNAYQLKKRVKFYRSALHLYLLQEHGIQEFQHLGSSLPSLYRGDFASYALFNIKERMDLDLKTMPSSDDLNRFYADPLQQQNITAIFRANLIRWQFSRVLEKCLLLDRVLWLREQGQNAQLFELFDPEISPRNVAIFIDRTS